MIFLGAGASVPFGIPTMSEFTDKITESLSNTNNKEWQNELLKIKAGLQTKRLRYDIEIIATALSIFSNTSVNTSYLAPFFAFSENLMPSSRPEYTSTKYVEDLTEQMPIHLTGLYLTLSKMSARLK
jgi:hypothetical protein